MNRWLKLLQIYINPTGVIASAGQTMSRKEQRTQLTDEWKWASPMRK